MLIVYPNYYYATNVVNYLLASNLSGIENDFKRVAFVDKIYDLEGLVSLSNPLNVLAGVNNYYDAIQETADLRFTVYNNTWYCFYMPTYTLSVYQNALIVDSNNNITAIIYQGEDWLEDYSLRTIYLDVMIKNGEFHSSLSTLRTEENFEEAIFCLDMRDITKRNVAGDDYLNIKTVKFEEDYDNYYVRALIYETGWYFNFLLELDNNYLCCFFTPKQEYRNWVNILQGRSCV